MNKAVMVLIIVVMCCFAARATNAMSWSCSCNDGSCEGSAGALRLYWTGVCANGDLTGVDGIPVSMYDYEKSEKKITQLFTEYIPHKQKPEAKRQVHHEEATSASSTGAHGSNDNVLPQEPIMSQGMVRDKKSGTHHDLAFVKWLGEARYSSEPGVIKYMRAAEAILNADQKGKVQDLIDQFFFERNGDRIDDVDIMTELNEGNREFILTKYFGLRYYSGIMDPVLRYQKAHGDILYLLNEAKPDLLQKILQEFKQHLDVLEVLLKPGQTSLALYRSGKKDLAYMKWFGDNAAITNILLPKDRYMVAITMAYNEGPQNQALQTRMNDFESAIAKKSPEVRIVTVRQSSITLFRICVLAAVVGGGYWYWRKRKKSSAADAEQER